jgi:branched-chain amino acid transport system substrate-binding protein
MSLHGVKLAVKYHPQILSKDIQLIIGNDKYESNEVINIIDFLINNNVVGVIGPSTSKMSLLSSELANIYKIPFIGTSATNPYIYNDEKNEYYYNIIMTDDEQGKHISNYILYVLNFKKVAVLADKDNPYSIDLANYFISNFIHDGGNITNFETYKKNDRVFDNQINAIIKNNPDVLFLPIYLEEGLTIIDLLNKHYNKNIVIFGADAFDNSQINLNLIFNDLYYSTFSYNFDNRYKSEYAQEFLNSWNKEYPNIKPNQWSEASYDSYMLLLKAIELANSTDPIKIKEALDNIEYHEMMLGIFSNDPLKSRRNINIIFIKKSNID